jgi:hypothetical protein
MIVFLLVFGVNVLITVAAFIQERGEDLVRRRQADLP